MSSAQSAVVELRFTRDAEADLLTVQLYTRESFGASVWSRYRAALTTAFRSLQDNPYLGADRSSVRAGTRRLLCRQHVIYYEVLPTSILVLRVLGVRQDPSAHLPLATTPPDTGS